MTSVVQANGEQAGEIQSEHFNEGNNTEKVELDEKLDQLTLNNELTEQQQLQEEEEEEEKEKQQEEEQQTNSTQNSEQILENSTNETQNIENSTNVTQNFENPHDEITTHLEPTMNGDHADDNSKNTQVKIIEPKNDDESNIDSESQTLEQNNSQEIKTLDTPGEQIHKYRSSSIGSGLSYNSESSSGSRNQGGKGYNRRGRGQRGYNNYNNNNNGYQRRQGRRNGQNNFSGGGYAPQMFGYPPPPISPNLFYQMNQQRMPAESFDPSKVIQQVEYYLSSENLVTDIYLRKRMNDDGWVPISVIAEFRRMKNLCPFGVSQIAQALKGSEKLELGRHNLVVRSHDRHQGFILPKTQQRSEVFEEVDRQEQAIILAQQQEQISMAMIQQQQQQQQYQQQQATLSQPLSMLHPSQQQQQQQPPLPPTMLPPTGPYPHPNLLPQYQLQQFQNFLFPMQLPPQSMQGQFQQFGAPPPAMIPPVDVGQGQGQGQGAPPSPLALGAGVGVGVGQGIQENDFGLNSSRSYSNGTGTWIKPNKVDGQ